MGEKRESFEGTVGDPLAMAMQVLFERAVGLADPAGLAPVEFADAVEHTAEFGSVVALVAKLERVESRAHWSSGEDRIVASTFFRSSGTFQSLHAGKLPNADHVAAVLRVQLLMDRFQAMFIAPIELVELSKDILEFGAYKIQRFSTKELDELLANDIRRAYYPSAVIDTDLLAEYHFLVATGTVEVRPLFDLASVFDVRVKHVYSNLPESIERAMYPLVLHNWVNRFARTPGGARPVKREDDDRTILPQIPFAISHADYFLSPPKAAPDTAPLAREPWFNREGEEDGDRPSYAYYLDQADTEALEAQLQRYSQRLQLIEEHQAVWGSVYTALGFLTKAFRTSGLEQLLWHVTTIEAALGQKVDGVTSLLNRRLRAIFAETDEDRSRIKKHFNAIYDFRSGLVHGNSTLRDKKIMEGHLSEARDFARGTVVWLIAALSHLACLHAGSGERIATRDELLAVLDMEPETRAVVAGTLALLPVQFPGVDDWLI